MNAAGCLTSAAGCLTSAVGCRMSAAGCLTRADGCLMTDLQGLVSMHCVRSQGILCH